MQFLRSKSYYVLLEVAKLQEVHVLVDNVTYYTGYLYYYIVVRKVRSVSIMKMSYIAE